MHNFLKHERTEGPPDAWCIDSGNRSVSGQVLCGSSVTPVALASAFQIGTWCQALPAPLWQHPELGQPDTATSPVLHLSCAELQRQKTQSLSINQAMAALAADYLFRLVISKSLNRFATYIDLHTGSMRSIACTPTNLEPYVIHRETKKEKTKKRP